MASTSDIEPRRDPRRARHGATVRGTVDVLIAAYCLEGGGRLLHADRAFKPFERYLGLVVL